VHEVFATVEMLYEEDVKLNEKRQQKNREIALLVLH
jgi:hypothetical protein